MSFLIQRVVTKDDPRREQHQGWEHGEHQTDRNDHFMRLCLRIGAAERHSHERATHDWT